MVAAALKLVGFDLQRQLARLKAQAEDFKDRTTDEIKHKAVNAGLMIGFAFAGLLFVVLTIVAGLIALYLWVRIEHGPFLGLGAVALTTAVAAALLFTIAATRGDGKIRGKSSYRPKPVFDAPAAAAAAATSQSFASPSGSVASASSSTPFSAGALGASLIDDITQDLTRQAKTVANEALDSAVEVVRKSPREAILITLAIAVVVGVVAGRRR